MEMNSNERIDCPRAREFLWGSGVDAVSALTGMYNHLRTCGECNAEAKLYFNLRELVNQASPVADSAMHPKQPDAQDYLSIASKSIRKQISHDVRMISSRCLVEKHRRMPGGYSVRRYYDFSKGLQESDLLTLAQAVAFNLDEDRIGVLVAASETMYKVAQRVPQFLPSESANGFYVALATPSEAGTEFVDLPPRADNSYATALLVDVINTGKTATRIVHDLKTIEGIDYVCTVAIVKNHIYEPGKELELRWLCSIPLEAVFDEVSNSGPDVKVVSTELAGCAGTGRDLSERIASDHQLQKILRPLLAFFESTGDDIVFHRRQSLGNGQKRHVRCHIRLERLLSCEKAKSIVMEDVGSVLAKWPEMVNTLPIAVESAHLFGDALRAKDESRFNTASTLFASAVWQKIGSKGEWPTSHLVVKSRDGIAEPVKLEPSSLKDKKVILCIAAATSGETILSALDYLGRIRKRPSVVNVFVLLNRMDYIREDQLQRAIASRFEDGFVEYVYYSPTSFQDLPGSQNCLACSSTESDLRRELRFYQYPRHDAHMSEWNKILKRPISNQPGRRRQLLVAPSGVAMKQIPGGLIPFVLNHLYTTNAKLELEELLAPKLPHRRTLSILRGLPPEIYSSSKIREQVRKYLLGLVNSRSLIAAIMTLWNTGQVEFVLDVLRTYLTRHEQHYTEELWNLLGSLLLRYLEEKGEAERRTMKTWPDQAPLNDSARAQLRKIVDEVLYALDGGYRGSGGSRPKSPDPSNSPSDAFVEYCGESQMAEI